jgi:hypothetical protein
MGLPPGDPFYTPWTGLGGASTRARVAAYRGLPPPQCAAVRRDGSNALMLAAANNDHPAIVQKLLDARANVNTQNNTGCALPRGPFGALSAGRPLVCRLRLRLRRLAGRQRCTMRRSANAPDPPWRCSSAAPTRASRTTTCTTGTLCRPSAHHGQRRVTPCRPQATRRPHTESVQANASPTRTKREQARRVRRGGGGGAAAALTRAPPVCAPCTPASHACTAAALHAETAFFGSRRLTHGMVCASLCARSAAVVGWQRAVREHTALPHTVGRSDARCGHGDVAPDDCEFCFAPTPLHVGRVVAVRTAGSGEGRGASCRHRSHVRTGRLWPKYASCARVHWANSVRNVFYGRLPPTPTARRNIQFSPGFGKPRATCQAAHVACHMLLAACRVAVPCRSSSAACSGISV